MINLKELKALQRKRKENLIKKLMADYLEIFLQELLQVPNNHYSVEQVQLQVLVYLVVPLNSLLHQQQQLEVLAFSKVGVFLEAVKEAHYLEEFLQEDLFLTQLLLYSVGKTLYLKLPLLKLRKTMKMVKRVVMMIMLVRETAALLLIPQVKM